MVPGIGGLYKQIPQTPKDVKMDLELGRVNKSYRVLRCTVERALHCLKQKQKQRKPETLLVGMQSEDRYDTEYL